MSAAGPAAASATDLEGKLIALEKKRKQLESELELLRAAKGAAPEDEKKGYTELIHAKVEEVVAATKRITTTSAQLDVEAQRRAMGSDAQAPALTPFLPAQFVPGQPALATCAGGPSPRLMSLATATPSSSAVDASPTGAVAHALASAAGGVLLAPGSQPREQDARFVLAHPRSAVRRELAGEDGGERIGDELHAPVVGAKRVRGQDKGPRAERRCRRCVQFGGALSLKCRGNRRGVGACEYFDEHGGPLGAPAPPGLSAELDGTDACLER